MLQQHQQKKILQQQHLKKYFLDYVFYILLENVPFITLLDKSRV